MNPTKMAPGIQRFICALHVTALSAVALIDEHVEAYRVQGGGWYLLQVQVKLVEQGAQQARRGRPELLHELSTRRDARRRGIGADHAGVPHHAFDLLVELVAVGHHQDAGLGVVLQQPLGDQHHQDALAAALGMPDHAALAPGNPFLRGLAHRSNWCALGTFFWPASKRMKSVSRSSSRDLLQSCASGRHRVPAAGMAPAGSSSFHSTKNCSGVPVVPVRSPWESLPAEHELHGAEETLVEDLFLVGDQLPDAVRQLDRAALQLDHREGKAVDVEHQVPAAAGSRP